MTHEDRLFAELARIGKPRDRAMEQKYYGNPADFVTFGKREVEMERMPDREAADSLLVEWFRWSASYRPKLGAPRVAPYCQQFQSSRQYDEDAAYSRIHVNKMKVVDWAIDSLAVAMQQTIGTEMRNRLSEAKVWRSPSNVTYAEALDAVVPKMRGRGLFD